MKTVFLLGPGFSAAANSYIASIKLPFAKPYPLVGDLGKECFGSDWDSGQGVENAFAEAIAHKDHGPIDKLVDFIQTADHYIGSRVADDGQSIFLSLVEAPFYQGSDFITFNYDSLLELVLVQQNLWTPYDGFGIKAEVSIISKGRTERCYQRSPIRVLHLHGSFCLYAREFEVEGEFKLKELPEFVFDPADLANDFHSGDFRYYAKGQQDLAYCHLYERVIVPVPNKAGLLRQGFIKEIYKAAKKLLEGAERLIAIGYSFSEYDLDSYKGLLHSFATTNGKPAFIVNRRAEGIVQRMEHRYPEIAWSAISLPFEIWARGGFKGV